MYHPPRGLSTKIYVIIIGRSNRLLLGKRQFERVNERFYLTRWDEDDPVGLLSEGDEKIRSEYSGLWASVIYYEWKSGHHDIFRINRRSCFHRENFIRQVLADISHVILLDDFPALVVHGIRRGE